MTISVADQVAKAKNAQANDAFNSIRQQTIAHRSKHGCGAYTYDKGPFLTALASILHSERILELGTALGYTALCLSEGMAHSSVTTIEVDPIHVELARKNIAQMQRANRIEVLQGRFEQFLPKFDDEFDLVFFDGFAPDMNLYSHINRVTKLGGYVVSANLSLWSPETLHYIDAINVERVWETNFIDSSRETAVSRKR